MTAAPQAVAPAAPAKSADTATGAAAAKSITNVQTAGVDGVGIVKRAGEHLVILRRGRLFTVRVGGAALQPAARVDAYAPGSKPHCAPGVPASSLRLPGHLEQSRLGAGVQRLRMSARYAG